MAIGADQIVRVIPGVISAGGSPLGFNGLFVTQSDRVPAGEVTSWSTPEAVSRYFGPTSIESQMATKYFLGYINSDTKPSLLYFASFVSAAVAGWIRGGAITQTLAQLQAITAGALTVSVDGTEEVLTGLDFSGAASFSAIAAIIQNALVTAGATDATVTFESDFNAFRIQSGTTGALSSVSFGTESLATTLVLTEALGAIQSDGLAVRTIAENMDAYTVITTNWVTFMHMFAQTEDEKFEFAQWANGKNFGVRYIYATWDDTATATDPNNDTNLGKRIDAQALSGTSLNYSSQELAAFVCAFTASLSFTTANGRATAAFKRQGGIAVTVNTAEDANGLIENGYNFYGDYATANDSFRWYYPGRVSGEYGTLIAHINAIYLNNAFQLALMSMFGNVKSVPYNLVGYDTIRAAMLDPITAALNFGAIRIGVTLSEAQKAQVDRDAGATISNVIESRGWFLQILDATAQTRANGGSPPIKFWYTDGGDVLRIELGSNVIL